MLEYSGHKKTLDIVLRYASRPTKDYRMPDESISQQSGNNVNNLCPCFSGANWFDAGKKIQFLSSMANVLSIIFIPAFVRSLGASYFDVGIIVRAYKYY